MAADGTHKYVFNLTLAFVGIVNIDVKLAGKPVLQSPFLLLVTPRSCEEGRKASTTGECRCQGGRMEVLRTCISRGAFMSGLLLPPLVVIILLVVIFVRAKIKAADAFWVPSLFGPRGLGLGVWVLGHVGVWVLGHGVKGVRVEGQGGWLEADLLACVWFPACGCCGSD